MRSIYNKISWDKFSEWYERVKEIEFMQLKQRSMLVWEYVSKFKEFEKYSTSFYHPDERMKYIKFENRLRPKLRKAVGILERYDFPTLIY